MGEIDDMSMSIDDLSDTEGSGLLDQSPPIRTRTWERRSRNLTPKIEEEDEEDILARSRRTRKLSAEFEDDVKLTKYDKKDSDEEYSSRRPSRDYLKVSDDDEFKPRRKISASKIEESPRKSQSPDCFTNSTKDKTSSLQRDKPHLYDDDNDDDLEEFLLKQSKRTRKLQTEGDSFEPISIRSRRSKSPTQQKVEDEQNGRDKGMSRDSSAASLGDDKTSDSKVRSLKRNKRRRRTIEQLTSPEHQAAKANGSLL